MSPAERLRVDRLVLSAAALEPAERAAFLAALPEEDSGLAAEVDRRLQAADALPEGFLDAPGTELLEAACHEPGAPEPEPPAGDERYEIGECLGAGGMARVYRAFDRRLGRPVALKILDASDPETPRRLLREARAQARVRHDHVLDVYETGELGGRPYIAVRYVAGGSLADLAASEVGLERRVRLLAQVAEGLHAAHREGLLHGDVKPSNVLVEETQDGEPKAWIGDFGIATGVEGADPGAGGLAGTPAFMAPERLTGDPAAVDRRSDVYSLGVTLFRVLTSAPPPGAGARWADLRERAPDLPPDLAAVVERCLASDPAARYPSARAVADDLRRFLDGEVVEAYADRRAYRLARFAARHRTLLAGAGVAALLLAAALAVAAVLGVQAVRANARADQRRSQAEDLIGFMLTDLRDKLEPVGRLDLLDDVGERALRYFAAVPEAELSDEELARRSTALYQIGDVRMRRGDLAGAERPLEESLALARQLAARDPDNAERLFGLGQSEFWAGYALWERGDPEGALRHFEAYRDVSERLVAREPENLDWRLELAYAHSNLGSVLRKQGDLPGALARFEQALAIEAGLVEEAPDSPHADAWRFELAAAHNSVGATLEELGRLAEAQEHYEADLALRRALVERDPENRRWKEFLGTSEEFLGVLLLARGDPGARAHLEAARVRFDELVAHDPANGDWRYKQAWSHLWLGRLERAEARPAAARAAWDRAEAIATRLAAEDAKRVDWRQLLGVARLHAALETAAPDPRTARDRAREAVALLEPLATARSVDRRSRRWLAEALLVLGDAEAAAGAPEAAERARARAAQTLSPLVEAGTRDPAVLSAWARATEALGRPREAASARARLAEIGYRQ
jgi:serine/threonine-protein kinase